MSATARKIVETDRRRAVLSALLIAPAYTLPERSIRKQVEVAGYSVGLDVLRADLSALADLGLVEPLELENHRLTDRGADVVLGRTHMPGIARPEPGEI
jgi:Fe2+ or Zn2+ uptake regulation protein